jgi:diacylglycerol kinase (ATP)
LKLLFVINPVSGGKDKSDWEGAIHAFCQQFTHTADLLMLTGEGDKLLLKNRVLAFDPDRVVAVGGDGTVKLVAEQVLGTATPMAILPAGSANGMAIDLNIPPAMPDALDVVANGQIRRLDTICIGDGDVCLHLSDIGMNAQLVRYYQQNNWRGKLGYARGAIRVLLNRRVLEVNIEVGDQLICRTAIMVVLANARRYGTGALINPNGDPADGLFEVVIVRRLSFRGLLALFWQYKPFDPTIVEIVPTKSVHITTRRKAYFQVDGEYRGRVNDVRAEIRPGQLLLLVPAG